MSSAVITPASLSAPSSGPRRADGATAVSEAHRPHRVGDALRAAKVFMGAVVGVVVLGEYAEEAGVRRR
ncbi:MULTISPECIES: hypothetical protein [unclassified Streptomyces]|uniref:hypothetical protein n=1 Tax=unclassified Streptomyces TaxID=2593676 RepID=UPI001162FD66|nr:MULTISPECIES: hypothetical protein [unclassified Streptomyces]QCX77395.1 hypothetical protein C9F11_18715 [Streptomyces sp. YIM 121038]